MTERICRTCGQSKPATTEYFNRASTNTDGLNRQCRDCRKAWATAYREANRDKIRAQNKAGAARARDVSGTCEIDGCGQPIYRRPHPWCGAHYARFRHYGDPLGTFTSRAQDITGQRFGMLTVIRQDGNRWIVECDCGTRKRVESGNLRHGSIISCGNHRRSDGVTYSGIHQRVRVDRGPARLQRCTDCGGTADDWSYDHADPDELHDENGRPYSADVEHYQPRCRSCHRKFDHAHDGGHDGNGSDRAGAAPPL